MHYCPNLKQFLFMVHIAERADAEYWDNPQVYLVPAGDEHVEAHFVLHNFKATEPLNTSQLKNLKIAGTLKYMVCSYMNVVDHTLSTVCYWASYLSMHSRFQRL